MEKRAGVGTHRRTAQFHVPDARNCAAGVLSAGQVDGEIWNERKESAIFVVTN
jgi:hypothetical protein